MTAGLPACSCFSALQQPENREQQRQTNQEEYDSAFAVQVAVEECLIYVIGQRGQGNNADAVLDDHDHEAGQDEDHLLPEFVQEEVTHQNRQHE